MQIADHFLLLFSQLLTFNSDFLLMAIISSRDISHEAYMADVFEVLLFEDAFLLPSHTKGRLTRYKIPDSQPFLSELL